MTAEQVWAELRRRGVRALAEGGRLRTLPAGAVPQRLRPALLAHRAELLELAARTCPECGASDFLPLSAGWRRCWPCGARWGDGGDPGEPPGLDLLAAWLGLSGQGSGAHRGQAGVKLPLGAVVRVEAVDDAGYRAWQVQTPGGLSVGAGLFYGQARALEHVRERGWRCPAAARPDDT